MKASEMTSTQKLDKLVDIIIDLSNDLTIVRNAFAAECDECKELRGKLADAKEAERALRIKIRVLKNILHEHDIDYSGEVGDE